MQCDERLIVRLAYRKDKHSVKVMVAVVVIVKKIP
jgi:hypothetical protein